MNREARQTRNAIQGWSAFGHEAAMERGAKRLLRRPWEFRTICNLSPSTSERATVERYMSQQIKDMDAAAVVEIRSAAQ